MHALIRGLQSKAGLLSSELQLGVRAAATAAGQATQAAGAAAAKPTMDKEFLVYRWSSESDAPPRYDSYKVDINA